MIGEEGSCEDWNLVFPSSSGKHTAEEGVQTLLWPEEEPPLKSTRCDLDNRAAWWNVSQGSHTHRDVIWCESCPRQDNLVTL